jgi:hypothetical protein
MAELMQHNVILVVVAIWEIITSAHNHPPTQLKGSPHISTSLFDFLCQLQVPVATILNDLSPVPCAPDKQSKLKKLRLLMTPVGIHSNSPDVKAMRYVVV